MASQHKPITKLFLKIFLLYCFLITFKLSFQQFVRSSLLPVSSPLVYVSYHQLMLQFPGNCFHAFEILSVAFTNQQKIILSFISIHTEAIFLYSFSNHVFATHNSFSLQHSSNLLPSTFRLPKPHPPCIPSKPSIRLPTCPFKSPSIEAILPGFCKSQSHAISLHN